MWSRLSERSLMFVIVVTVVVVVDVTLVIVDVDGVNLSGPDKWYLQISSICSAGSG